ncbi:dihydroxyacetone kinase DhaL subunit [Cricetibacter osteomyelitidis]|uniref:Dihydroxyacetone kinase DhaL subunit n=1 Tax=Cricetibacter osteomyelitidis TaxID=1521931 RepID=A0A4R2SYX6_9PAST|nr:dihydroxyacetone kinase subunit DhaL [Cricetibacter osteomyelitidis]TCP95727.1 dihydroxyacetone kinase DhaL subunit [Cricetibacter osteomyelitidis]
MNLTKQQIIQWLTRCDQLFDEHKDYLTQLDTEIGDGDHGANMHRGFTKVMEKLLTVTDKDIGTIFKTVGMTLLSSVGGASGPLFGTFFIKGAQIAVNKQELTLDELTQILAVGVEGIVARGRAEIGDKTMCDVWLPVVEVMRSSQDDLLNTLQSAVKKSEECLVATISMKAKKGRASYLNERSIGHQDPGATSVVYMLQALTETVVNKE